MHNLVAFFFFPCPISLILSGELISSECKPMLSRSFASFCHRCEGKIMKLRICFVFYSCRGALWEGWAGLRHLQDTHVLTKSLFKLISSPLFRRWLHEISQQKRRVVWRRQNLVGGSSDVAIKVQLSNLWSAHPCTYSKLLIDGGKMLWNGMHAGCYRKRRAQPYTAFGW